MDLVVTAGKHRRVLQLRARCRLGSPDVDAAIKGIERMLPKSGGFSVRAIYPSVDQELWERHVVFSSRKALTFDNRLRQMLVSAFLFYNLKLEDK